MRKIPDDIKEMEERIARFENKNGAIKRKGLLTNNRLFAKGFVLGTEFLCAVLVGVGIGFFLDRIFGVRVLFTIIFALFGCAAGVVNMYRSAKGIEKELE